MQYFHYNYLTSSLNTFESPTLLLQNARMRINKIRLYFYFYCILTIIHKVSPSLRCNNKSLTGNSFVSSPIQKFQLLFLSCYHIASNYFQVPSNKKNEINKTYPF